MSANKTLKTRAHAFWDPAYAEWDANSGVAKFGSDATVDALLPGKIAYPSRLYYVSFIIAKSNRYVIFPNTAYIYAGFWLNNGASSYWIQGKNPFTVAASVQGNPSTTTDRKYKIFARTDRATSFLSAEVDVADAPDLAAFNLGASVSLSWDRLQDVGIISYDVYRKSGATYELLQRVESGANTYLDNNVDTEIVTGYPVPTGDRSIALTTTRTNTTTSVLNGLFINGVSAQWSTISFPIPVPPGFDMSVGGEQWLRIGIGGLDGFADLSLPGVAVAAGVATSEIGLFTADQVSLNVTLTDSDGNIFHSVISAYTSATEVTLSPAPPDGTYRMYIFHGAGDHCLLMDLIHSSFGDGATYGANDNDYTPPRPQFPRAAPNGSNQGGSGQGGGPSDGGGPTCVEVNEPLLILYGNTTVQKRFGDASQGDVLESGNMAPNVILTPPQRFGCPDLWYLETENGCSLTASPSHPVFRNRLDKNGTTMDKLTTKMKVYTNVNGAYGVSPITSIGPTGKEGIVGMISCGPTASFVAGNCSQGWGGIVCHNRKPIDENGGGF